MIMLSKKYKFPVKIIRFYQIYGPRQDLNRFLPIVIKNCLRKKKFDTSDGTQYRDFTYVDDVNDLIIKSLDNSESNGKVFNVASGKAIKVKKVILDIKNIINKGNPKFGKIQMRKDEINKIYANIK